MKVINVGSGLTMVNINEWDTANMTIVGVNNVWKGTNKWDHLICAGDYPQINEIKHTKQQRIHSANRGWNFKKSYTAMANKPWAEARLYLGLPIYFTAAYWSLYYLKPKYLGFIGFDMNYTPDKDGNTAFYGVGYDIKKRGMSDVEYQIKKAYKDEPNVMSTLFERLDSLKEDCKLFNLSEDPNSILPWEKISFEDYVALGSHES